MTSQQPIPHIKSTTTTPIQSFSKLFITTVLPTLAILLAVLALWLWYTETRDRSYADISRQATTTDERADIVLERANDAINSAELILSFLEGASVLITVAVAAAAIFGLSNVNELRSQFEETKARLEEAESNLRQREARLYTFELEFIKIRDEARNAQRQLEALERYSLAEQLMRERNLDAALVECAKSYALDPKNYTNNYLFGSLLMAKGQFREATQKLEEALEVEPSFAVAIASLGLAYRRLGELTTKNRGQQIRYYNMAEEKLLTALELDDKLLNNDGESYQGTLGSLYRRQGRIFEAIARYKQAAKVTPGRSYPFVNLGLLYFEEGQNDLRDQYLRTAKRNAERRINDTPSDYWALFDLAQIELILGNRSIADERLKDAIEFTPPSLSVYYSVYSRLEFLQLIDEDLDGLQAMIDMISERLTFLSQQDNGQEESHKEA